MPGTLTVGTLDDGTDSVKAEDITNGTCRAWVNFNGTGTVAIRHSYNVSSITDVGTGIYTVHFTINIANANYACVISCSGEINTQHGNGYFGSQVAGAPGTYTASQVNMGFVNSANSTQTVDKSIVNVVVFGDPA